MKAHMSRLEKDRAAVAARKAAGVSSPALDSRLPSYMRQTAASAAMQKVSLLTHLSNPRFISVLWASKAFHAFYTRGTSHKALLADHCSGAPVRD